MSSYYVLVTCQDSRIRIRGLYVSAAYRRAVKMAAQVVAKGAKKNWKQLGLYSLTFYGYIKPNGKITIET